MSLIYSRYLPHAESACSGSVSSHLHTCSTLISLKLIAMSRSIPNFVLLNFKWMQGWERSLLLGMRRVVSVRRPHLFVSKPNTRCRLSWGVPDVLRWFLVDLFHWWGG